ncbi:hypothetical protein VTJ83DRAFT_6867 [Remersonia thermophila]|uniref:Glycosyl transferase CAP10 domain-containing protein n=1 Tax=Remersonia thermophila TaxID=72144 RepID=A0ABR4D664_9PEZI
MLSPPAYHGIPSPSGSRSPSPGHRARALALAPVPVAIAACAACLCAYLRGVLPCAAFGTASGTGPEEGEVLSEMVGWGVVVLAWSRGWGGWRGGGNGWRETAGEEEEEVGRVAPAVVLVLVSSAYQAEVGPVWLIPALPPLVLAAEAHLRPDASLRAARLRLVAMAIAALLALLPLFALRYWGATELARSALPAAALLAVAMLVLAGVLAWQLVTYGTASVRVGWPAVLTGLIKGLSWCLTIQVASSTSWCLAPAIATFGLLASRDPAIHPSEWHALAASAAAFVALLQIGLFLPRTKGRLLLLGLALLPLGPAAVDVANVRRVRSYHLAAADHPVERLVRDARNGFHRMLERQSKTYSEAAAEYRRRYGADPPPGFEAWYGYAVEIGSPIIDEFDGIYRSLLPFWRLSGRDVAAQMAGARRLPSADLWTCTLSSATAVTNCTHPWRSFDRHYADMFNRLLGGLRQGVLPRDATFLINHLDEPAVMFPRSANPGKPATITSLAGRAAWDAVAWSCGVGKRRAPSEVETYGLPLVTNATEARDLCAHPEYARQHGLFVSPTSFRLIEGRVPVLSTGAPSTMADILFPSPAHVVEPEFRYDPSEPAVPWHRKRDALYWAGADTGGVVVGASEQDANRWRRFHRQRFVLRAQGVERPPGDRVYLSETAAGAVAPVSARFLNTHLYRRSAFRLLGRQPASASYDHKLAFDLDGNGISGRFPRLLASGSLVLKQVGGLLEWWNDDGGRGDDGRVRAWVHYVPVSMDMGELPELVHFLLETDKGRKLAREVAEEGRAWVAKAMREEDVRLWVWRLVLELARLTDPERGPLA